MYLCRADNKEEVRAGRAALMLFGLAIPLAVGLREWMSPRAPQRPIRVGFWVSPPFQLVAADGSAAGSTADILKEAARRAGYPLTWVQTKELPETMFRQGKIDLWVDLTVTEERKKLFYMTRPWQWNEFILVSLATTPEPEPTEVSRAAILDAPVDHRFARQWLTKAELLPQPDRATIFRRVCEGAAPYGMMTRRTALYLMVHRPEGCQKQPLKLHALHDDPTGIATAADPGFERYADRLREEISRMAADGAMHRIYSRYSDIVGTDVNNVFRLQDAEHREMLLKWGLATLAFCASLLLWQMLRLSQTRRKLERALKRSRAAEVAKNDFLATMTHEIRTPLHGFLGLTKLLLDSPLNPEQRDYASTALRSALHLSQLLNDVLDYSKLEAGRMQVESVPVELSPMLDSVTKLVMPMAQENGLAVSVHIDPTVPAVLLGDETRLRQVLWNLLGNAVKFTVRGSVTVRVDRLPEPDRLRFTVRDTGIGIPAAKMARMFEKFDQADASMSRRFGGTGLGLAITHRLVQLMNGEVGVESQPALGTTIWFTLPLYAAAAGPKATAPSPGLLSARILLVEDNPVNQLLARKFLAMLGTEVEVAHDGFAAIEAAAARPFDAILMDCQMPECDGYQATRAIRERPGPNANTPIIALTANAGADDRRRCLEAGMTGFLSKPFSITDLENSIRTHCAIVREETRTPVP